MERKPEEKKGLFTKLKENIDDHEEQMQILGAMVRLGVVIWSGFIITLNYVELPMVKKSGASADITFVASVFTGALATFGLTTGNGKKDKEMERKPEEKKGLFTKLKENIDDHEEQMQILGAMVRLGVVIWSGFIITLNYVELPMVKKSNTSADITFVASVFTGALATFGLTTGNGKKDKEKPKT